MVAKAIGSRVIDLVVLLPDLRFSSTPPFWLGLRCGDRLECISDAVFWEGTVYSLWLFSRTMLTISSLSLSSVITWVCTTIIIAITALLVLGVAYFLLRSFPSTLRTPWTRTVHDQTCIYRDLSLLTCRHEGREQLAFQDSGQSYSVFPSRRGRLACMHYHASRHDYSIVVDNSCQH